MWSDWSKAEVIVGECNVKRATRSVLQILPVVTSMSRRGVPQKVAVAEVAVLRDDDSVLLVSNLDDHAIRGPVPIGKVESVDGIMPGER
jgi:hypothetical protein